jgi:Ca2+-binding RTX toxin-like protein
MAVTPSPTDIIGQNYNFMVFDTSTGANGSTNGDPYTGPVSGVSRQYVDLTPDNLLIKATVPGMFIHSGSGTDAITVVSGANIVDGGTGSNFLTGGSGSDTFFVDERGATSDIWDTVVNFHAGDAVTFWGVTPAGFSLDWVDGQGAPGNTGLTLHATAPGKPTASLTLVGFNKSALSNGQLSISYGTDPAGGGSYMYIKAN